MNQNMQQESFANEIGDTTLKPRGSAEEIVLAAWMKVLGEEVISTDQEFLQCGGDSILTIQVVSECRSHGLMVTVQWMMQLKTISHIARHTKVGSMSLELADDKIVDSPFALSPIQQLYIGVDSDAREVYNLSCTLRYLKALSFDELRRAIRAIVSCHSMLRARFSKGTDGWE